MTKVMLAEMCQADLRDRSFEVAVLPIGSCEVHGPHLPFGNDALQVTAIARRAAERAAEKGAQALVLPTIPFGCDQNLMEFPYTVTLSPRTILALLDEVIGSVARHGMKKFLLLNGHGGNTGTLDAALRELYGRYGAFLARLDFWLVAADVADQVRETSEIEHADEIETSIALALYPHLVNMAAAEAASTRRSCLPLLERYGGKFSRPWHLFTRNGGVGDPTCASAEKGRKVVEATVKRLADILVELAQAECDLRFPYPDAAEEGT